jgi:hypothetical protein
VQSISFVDQIVSQLAVGAQFGPPQLLERASYPESRSIKVATDSQREMKPLRYGSSEAK